MPEASVVLPIRYESGLLIDARGVQLAEVSAREIGDQLAKVMNRQGLFVQWKAHLKSCKICHNPESAHGCSQGVWLTHRVWVCD